MDKLKRSERVAAITRALTREPGRLFTLREFVEWFGCAKSTLSEDITTVRTVLARYGLGVVESVNGAAGGVRFYPFNEQESDRVFIESLCKRIAVPERILPGGYLYTVDLFSDARLLSRMGEVFAKRFGQEHPDVIVTVESMGVPIALMVSHALGKPLVTARRDSNHIAVGSVVTLNYMSATNRNVQTMSLPRRSLQAGQRALIIDDFMKGGGTLKALASMLQEFGVSVCGMGVIMATQEPAQKRSGEYVPLMKLFAVDEDAAKVDIRPAEWLGWP